LLSLAIRSVVRSAALQGCRLDSVQDVDAAAWEPTCVIALKTRKTSNVSEFCDESKGPSSPILADASRRAGMPAAVFTSGTCSGESQKRHFMSLSGSSNDNFVHV